jgi:organic hydroperoxide reductase OsmC/OhrA
VSTVHDSSVAVGWTGQRTLTIDRTEQAGGMGLGYSGGELLCLAIGACYTNDLFREAAKRGLAVTSVAVEVTIDWGDGTRAHSVSYSATVEAEASEPEIQALMTHTDQIAEIHNSLRTGAPVTLAAAHAIAAPRRDATP